MKQNKRIIIQTALASIFLLVTGTYAVQYAMWKHVELVNITSDGEQLPPHLVISGYGYCSRPVISSDGQMRWSQQGAHLLLQVRTRVLNDELREELREWYPSFTQGDEYQRRAA